MNDFLLECNNLRIPDQDFVKQFCVRCLNQECQRSRPQGSRFDQRVATWESRLFLDVPRLTPDDPRYGKIANQDFVEVAPGWGQAPYEVQGWGEAAQEPKAPTLVGPVATEPAASNSPALGAPAPQPSRFQGQALNTPAKQGMMLGNAPAPVAQDPWAGPPALALAAGEVIIRPGARIKIGGSGS
jgi:hypothetical protein